MSVAPSVSRLSAAFATVAPVAVLLTGCVSTRTVAARARLVDARTLASQSVTQVRQANPAVSVKAPVVIHTHAATAIVVALRNDSAHALTDLPISIGVRTRSGRKTYLNRSTTLDYYASHVASLGPRETTTWVFTTSANIPPGRAFATVGISQLHPTVGQSLPLVAVSSRSSHDHGGAVTLKLSIANRSVVPQYDLPVYAIAFRAGHEVAAGRTAVPHLGTDATTTSTVSLVGSPRYDSLQLIAPPSIFN